MRLNGKTVIITGAASGIGQAIAYRFAEEGANLVLVDIVPKAGEETLRKCLELGVGAFFVPADLSQSSDSQVVVSQAVKNFGQIDALVNNAGIFEFGTVLDYPEESWDRMMAVNLKSMFLMCKYSLPPMLETGSGSIINIASVGALVGVENATAYAASKGGVIQLTRSMALDFGKNHVRVNCICPGSIETDMLRGIWEYEGGGRSLDEIRKEYVKGRPLHKIGTPRDVANAALYLASDESQFVTGTCLTVDGGITAM